MITDKQSRKNIGHEFKRWREQAKLSQITCAQRLGYSGPQIISNLERGTCLPPPHMLKKFLALYNVPIFKLKRLYSRELLKSLDRLVK